MPKRVPEPSRCKYCGMRNHVSDKCFHKRNITRHRCVLCRGNHASDSIICPVFQKTRTNIGINLSRREKQVISRKEGKITILSKKPNEKTWSARVAPKPRNDSIFPANLNVAAAHEHKRNEEKEEEKKPPTIQPKLQPQPKKQRQQRRKRNYNNDPQDEVSQLRNEIAELRSTVHELTKFFKQLAPLLQSQQDFQGFQDQDNTQTSYVDTENDY